ncbi:MAG: hypothetical protein ACXVNM_11310 [Bacteroidia bacterium]
MRKKSFFLTIALFLALCFSKLNAQTVYITDSGKKYHAKNCNLVKTGKKGIQLIEATKQGYEPCKICKADAIKATPVKKESPKSNK